MMTLSTTTRSTLARLLSHRSTSPSLLYGRTQRYTTPTTGAVKLKFSVSLPSDGNRTEGALVLLHGLFGSKRNWLSLSKAFARDLNLPVYALDLRNQGESPHVQDMTYSHMAEDVLNFLHEHKLSNINLLGHSMGGKVGMALTLNPFLPAGTVSKLIVEDVAPVRTKLSPEFAGYIKGMQKIENDGITTRKEAKKVLEAYETNESIQHFLLTNFHVPHASSDQPAKFAIPLDILAKSIREIGSFPYTPADTTWTGKTLFIKGSRSKYINTHNLPLCREFFPQMTLQTLDTDHWVHSERPNEFKKIVTDFITSSHNIHA